MNSMILESTIDAMEDALTRTTIPGPTSTLIYRIEEVVHDTQTLLMIKRRRPDIDERIQPSQERDLLRYMTQLMTTLNTPIKTGSTVRYKSMPVVRRAIRKTIDSITLLNL